MKFLSNPLQIVVLLVSMSFYVQASDATSRKQVEFVLTNKPREIVIVKRGIRVCNFVVDDKLQVFTEKSSIPFRKFAISMDAISARISLLGEKKCCVYLRFEKPERVSLTGLSKLLKRIERECGDSFSYTARFDFLEQK